MNFKHFRILKLPVLVLMCAAAFAPSAHAQWAVFDASNLAQAIKEFKQLQQMYTTARQTRDQIVTAYNLAYQMSRMPQDFYQRYRADFSEWANLSAPNTYGNTGAWIDALNFGAANRANTAYTDAVTQPQNFPPVLLRSLDADTQALIKNQYATSELGQGTITGSLSTLGGVRSHSEAFARKLANLEADTFSTNPSQQTELAVLGKINSAALLELHSQQDTNQVLAASVAEQALADKQRMDEQNRLINQAIYFHQNFPTTMQNLTAGLGNALRSISLSTNGR
jgi:Domain of unknown function (DUF4141)